MSKFQMIAARVEELTAELWVLQDEYQLLRKSTKYADIPSQDRAALDQAGKNLQRTFRKMVVEAKPKLGY